MTGDIISTTYALVIDLRAVCQKEFGERELVVKLSPEYTALETLITDLQTRLQELKGKQDAMLAAVPDSTEALRAAEKELFELMQREGKAEVGDCRLKYSESNSVNKARLLERAGGDLDLVLELSTFTLKGVREYAKTSGDKSFLDCIETTFTPSGLEFDA